MRRIASVASFALAVPFLAIAACAAPTDAEETASTDSALTSSFTAPMSALSVTSTESSVSVTYQRNAFFNQFQVSLTGPNLATTLGDANLANGFAGVTFTGLDACSSFQYTLTGAGQTLSSGTINTRAPGGGVCAASERLGPTNRQVFRGVNHARFDHSWCSSGSWNDAYRTYPEGSAWHWYEINAPLTPGDYGDGVVGYTHFFDGGSGPFPCGERFVDVSRTSFSWAIDPARIRRAQSAMLHANFTGGVCVSDIASVNRVFYPVTQAEANNLNDYGHPWSSVVGGLSDNALERQGMRGYTGIAGNEIVATLTGQIQFGGTIMAGFAVNEDGFPQQNNDSGVYASDNNSCQMHLSNVQLELTYAPLPPDSPMNCTVAVGCGNVQANCDNAPDTFELHKVLTTGANYIAAMDASPARTWRPSMFGQYQTADYGASYYVCTVSGSQRACTPYLPVGAIACAPIPTGGGGGTSGGITPPHCVGTCQPKHALE